MPPLKKALEIVIYQVKMLLTENRIPPSAFFMGNVSLQMPYLLLVLTHAFFFIGALKHRDIRGAEISSQVSFIIDEYT